ncbi:hypothetical protein [Saccharicrinis aurantiacus]|uniref:hypothetical protein n=1 Tax=Saccharicrinis aurantiacus TaxID=1849719 RepID=UPI00248FA526|nr:hypothetical protein [Saccharicrinis aurantiacus]
MKKSAEQEIRQQVEAWDEKSSDIGFDKALVWQNINNGGHSAKPRITWRQIAVAVIIFLLLGGWGHSEYRNAQLAQSTTDMAHQIQVLQNSAKSAEALPVKQQAMAQIVTDTIVKIIVKQVYVNEASEELSTLKNEYQQSVNALAHMQEELSNSKQALKQYEDSLAALNSSLLVYQQAEVKQDVSLEINEAALVASLNPEKENAISSSQEKNKVKLVIFNKSKSTISKAPASGRIRL